MTEDEIKKAMGGKYHICHMCSVYCDVASRELCRLSKPATVKDIERLEHRLMLLEKRGLWI